MSGDIFQMFLQHLEVNVITQNVIYMSVMSTLLQLFLKLNNLHIPIYYTLFIYDYTTFGVYN